MQHHENRVIGCRGLGLYEQCWLPDGDVRSALIIVHGLIEHSGRYAELAQRLTCRGYAVYAMDLRGHGRSDGPRCFVRRFDDYLADLDPLVDRVRGRQPGKRLFLLGHSMGGTIVALWTIRRQPDLAGLILSASALRVPRELFPILRRLAGVVSLIFPALRVARFGSGYMARDPAVVEQFRQDPLVFHGRLPTRTGAELLRATRLVQDHVESVRAPLLVMHGTADRLCDFEANREFCRRAASADKTLRLYEGFYHDILREQDHQQVVGDLTAWLDARSLQDSLIRE
jgi:acylglycerol lipase